MKREISVERTYVLGQYKNIKVSDTISDIPQELFLNEEFMSHLRSLQLLKLDEVYYQYLKNSLTLQEGLSVESATEAIDKASAATLERLHESVASVNKE